MIEMSEGMFETSIIKSPKSIDADKISLYTDLTDSILHFEIQSLNRIRRIPFL